MGKREFQSNLVSCKWLKQNQSLNRLVILDATMKKKPNGEKVPTPEAVIPNALMFNFDTSICDQATELPHMLPEPSVFEKAIIELGINHDSIIVIYDAMGIFSSPRAWWMFKVMGHQQVYVLDGGLPEWNRLGFASANNYRDTNEKGDFKACLSESQVYSAQQVFEAINSSGLKLLDARSFARFNAIDAEPRKGLRAGHIPNSVCLPYEHLLEHGLFKPVEYLRAIFESTLDQFEGKLIFSCGSGVTACILALAVDECGYQNYAVYDGSWSEWGANDALPIDI